MRRAALLLTFLAALCAVAPAAQANSEKRPRWDSGLINADGTPRPTFRTLKAQIRKYAR